jgi:hypothetical protein
MFVIPLYEKKTVTEIQFYSTKHRRIKFHKLPLNSFRSASLLRKVYKAGIFITGIRKNLEISRGRKRDVTPFRPRLLNYF